MSDFNLEITPKNIELPWLNLSVSESLLISWLVMVILMVVSLIIRLFILKRFEEIPKGFQNIIELMVEGMERFTQSNVGHLATKMAPYTFTLALYIVSCGLIELTGLRSPLADLNNTAALALLSFFIINITGLRQKGLWGRIKALSRPNFLMLPIKLVTEVAIPVSLACRLYGNMLGGLIVMELLYMALPLVVPAFLSIYFTLFHAGIQAYIFVTLTLVFTHEAAE